MIELTFVDPPRIAPAEAAGYRAVVRAAFGQRRKTLRNSLGALARTRGFDPPALAAAFERAGIASDLRAERLAIADFARLARALAK